MCCQLNLLTRDNAGSIKVCFLYLFSSRDFVVDLLIVVRLWFNQSGLSYKINVVLFCDYE